MRTSRTGLFVRLLAILILASGVMASHTGAAQAPAKVDLNTASEKDLDTLPGIGPATAKKIIAGRPYAAIEDLSKAGVRPAVIAKITPLVTVGGQAPAVNSRASATTAPASQAAPAPPAQSAPGTATRATSSPVSQGTPGPGMVWVNLESGVYHYPSSRYYGKTKSGKYLSEADAVKAGYRAAKNEKKPQ